MTRISTSYFNQSGLRTLLNQQSELARVQAQISSGNRIQTPSDDPAGAAQVMRLSQAISITEQYQRNGDILSNRLSLEESTMGSLQDSLIRIRDLALQANSAVLSDSDRVSLAGEVRQRLQEILALANTRDANSEYLFSGHQVNTKPFAQNPDGSFSYFGDQGERELQISTGQRLADSHSGVDVFTNIRRGNGIFQVSDNVANTGTGVISPGTVTDSATYVEDTYTISFVTNSSGNLAYNVIGAASGQVIPALPLDAVNDAPDYVEGTSIQFNGIELSLTGVPDVGDTYTVSPSEKQDMFTTVSNLITALETDTFSPAADARVNNQINNVLSDIDLAINNVILIRTEIGARLNTLESQQQTNTTFMFELQSTRSRIQDLDITSAVVELQSRLNAFEAAQASFVRIQNLSLFNVIS